MSAADVVALAIILSLMTPLLMWMGFVTIDLLRPDEGWQRASWLMGAITIMMTLVWFAVMVVYQIVRAVSA